MNGKPIAYVMEQTLGSVTHYQNLRREESFAEKPAPRWLPIEYRPGRLPWPVTASWLARQALGAVINDIDGIFMHTTTMAPLSVDYFRRKPAVLSSDGTPLNKRGVRQAYGLKDESPLGPRRLVELDQAILRRRLRLPRGRRRRHSARNRSRGLHRRATQPRAPAPVVR